MFQLAILNAASVFGRTIPNIIADRYGKFNVTIPIAFANGILVFAMLGIKNTGGVIIFSILYGFTSGACKWTCGVVFGREKLMNGRHCLQSLV